VRRIKECDPNHSGSSSDACIQACNPLGEELVSDFYDELKHFADTCDFVVQADQICHHLYMAIAFQVGACGGNLPVLCGLVQDVFLRNRHCIAPADLYTFISYLYVPW
jgi:hypothetical protein